MLDGTIAGDLQSDEKAVVQSQAKKILDKMSLRDKIGQVMAISHYGYNVPPKVEDMFREIHPGELRLCLHYKDCIPQEITEPTEWKTRDAALNVINEARSVFQNNRHNIPPFITVDQEGGIPWSDMSRDGINLFPMNMGIAYQDDVDFTRKVAATVARQLRSFGISMIHSPVVDININPRNPGINIRAFGETPEKVARHAVAYIEGLHSENMISTVKHFPGCGMSNVDTHFDIDVLNADRQTLFNRELVPYKYAIEAGVDAVMLAHMSAPALDPSGVAATVSKTMVNDIIRGELGFEGVITTDSMTMGGIIKLYGLHDACARALAAGADIILMKLHPETMNLFNHLLRCVEDGEIPIERIDEAVLRILNLKLRFNLFDEPLASIDHMNEVISAPETKAIAWEAAEKAVFVGRQKEGVLPLSPDSKILVIEPRMQFTINLQDPTQSTAMLYESIKKQFNNTELLALDEDGTLDDETLESFSQYDAVIVGYYNYRKSADHLNTAQAAIKASNKSIIVTNNLYFVEDLKEADAVFVTHGIIRNTLEIVADKLKRKN